MNCDHPASDHHTLGLLTVPQSCASTMMPGTPVSFSKCLRSAFRLMMTFSMSLRIFLVPKRASGSANHRSMSSNFWPSGPSRPSASGRMRLKSGQGGAAVSKMAHSLLGSSSSMRSRRAWCVSSKMSPRCSRLGHRLLEIRVHASSTSQEILCQIL